MNREHALRYLTVLTADVARDVGLAPTPTEHSILLEQTVRGFVDAFPARHRGESVYERLSRPADPQRLAAFKAALDQRKGVGNAGETAAQSHFRWAAVHFGEAQKPLEHKAPEPVRVIPRPPSAQALWCVAALERLSRNDELTSEERRRVKAEMTDVIAAWGEEINTWTEDGTCPDCATGYLQELDASVHLNSCSGHLAFAHLDAAREAARIVGAHLAPSVKALQPPPQPRSVYGSPWEATDALAFLLESPSARAARGRTPEQPLALLTRIGREWAHFIDRTSDPCPWCGEVLPLPQLHGHLRACSEHPAEKAARLVRSAGQVPVGLERLVFERMAARRELVLLSQASATFDSNMGWTGEAGYSDKYSEKPWRAAIERAGKFLGLPERKLLIARPEASPLREAMTRLLSESPQPVKLTAADIETVRGAAAQFDQWVTSIGFATTCPACRRKGVPRADLPGHLETCPLHPAVQRVRANAAVRQLREGVEVPQLWLGEYDPEDYRERIHEYLHDEREKALAALFEFEASELSKDQPSDLLRFVRNWEELQSVAANPPCPWCGVGARTGEHLQACAKHPATIAEPPRGELEQLAARFQLEADQCAVRLARLHEACKAFWNGMSDGEDGKSVSNPRIEAMWKEARDEAAAVLASVKERPSEGA